MTNDGEKQIIGLLTEIRDLLKAGAASSDPNFKEGVFTGWKAARVPGWAKFDKGVQFGDLSGKSLDYWINSWAPNGYNGNPPKPEDMALRKLLDEGKAEVESGAYVPPQYTNKPREPKKDAASSRPAPRSKPTPPPQDDDDGSNVPF